jgi:ubiquinone/menaquinone biosynthesis C-methylase UbiE
MDSFMNTLNAKQSFFDELAGGWDHGWQPENRQRLEEIFSGLLPEFRGPVLDLGCGTGVLLPFIKKYGRDPHFLVQADISMQMIRSAEKQSRAAQYGTCLQGDGHFLPFREAQFGAVFCFRVFPHFFDKTAVIQECHRVLQPHGQLIILHLMGHRELNEMHRRAGRIVENEHILPAAELSGLVANERFRINEVLENSRLYLVTAVRL